MKAPDILIAGVAVKPAARDDIREILVFLGANEPQRAVRFANSLLATIEQLAAMPHLGSPRRYDDARLHRVSQWPVQNYKNYLIFYRPFASSNGIEILRILHAARNVAKLLADEARQEN